MVGDGDGDGDDGGSRNAEADQWLITSEKLLASSDFEGAKKFAICACETDPSRADAADYILAISDTLLAGESTVGGSKLPDWYGILRLVRLTRNPEHVAIQYRRLALLLNPMVNRLPFADQALKLVSDAWCVLSDPPRKSMYDQELQMSQIGGGSTQSEQFQWRHDSPLQSQAETSENISFWTACPYCYVLFEYPKGYEECILRCDHCKRAFEAVTTQTPPVDSDGKGVYFCSWGMFPLGYSGEAKSSSWSPISHLFVCPAQSYDQQVHMNVPTRNYCDNDGDDLYVEISDDDDDLYVAISDDDDAKKSKKGG